MKNLSKVILLGLFSATALVSAAQKKDDANTANPFISIEGGVGIPVGRFSLPIAGPYPVGFALPGFGINALAAYPLEHGGVAAVGNIGYHSNKLDANQYVKYVAHATTPVSSTAYRGGNLSAGLMYVSSMKQKVMFDMKVLVGACLFYSPDVKYNTNLGIVEESTSGSCITPVVSGGMGLMYAISDKMLITLDAGVLYTAPVYKGETGDITASYMSKDSEDIKVCLVEVNLGIGYCFGK